MDLSRKTWIRISLLNLMIVASLGVMLRYKINFALPWIDQKKLLEGHSHFAFAGWITQTLMILMLAWLEDQTSQNQFYRYRWLLFWNLFTAYGMLISFPIQGYAFFAVLFSTFSIFVSYAFAYLFWSDLNKHSSKSNSIRWFKIALLGNVFSSLGPFSLAYMMATKDVHQNLYLASIYFFLHFQYNVWFFFAAMGLAVNALIKMGLSKRQLSSVFMLFALATAPTYLLSVLWWPLGIVLFVITIMAVICQLFAWGIMIRLIIRHWSLINRFASPLNRFMFVSAGIALTLKLLLQTASVFPSLSKLAFGFRPIVIGYLHLVLLGIITIFILAWLNKNQLIENHRRTKAGLLIFICGILINEGLLMIQGLADIQYSTIPYVDFLLFLAALILFSGAGLIFLSQFSQDMIRITKRSDGIT
jgi:hypothetical protein